MATFVIIYQPFQVAFVYWCVPTSWWVALIVHFLLVSFTYLSKYKIIIIIILTNFVIEFGDSKYRMYKVEKTPWKGSTIDNLLGKWTANETFIEH